MAPSREHADGAQDRRHHSQRGLLAGAAGALGTVAAESVAGAGTAQATQGKNVMLGTGNTGDTHRTGIFTMGNSEWAQLANPRNTGFGPQGVYAAGQAGIGGKAVSGTGAGGLGASSGIGAGGAFGVCGTAAGRRRTRLFGLTLLVAVVGLAAALAGCGGSTSPAAGTAAPSAAGQAATAPAGSGPAREACALVTAAGLRSLGVTGAGNRQESPAARRRSTAAPGATPRAGNSTCSSSPSIPRPPARSGCPWGAGEPSSGASGTAHAARSARSWRR
jgi:hypothetical protein